MRAGCLGRAVALLDRLLATHRARLGDYLRMPEMRGRVRDQRGNARTHGVTVTINVKESGFVLLAIGILVFLFWGEPDVHDLFKAWLAKL